MTDQPSLCDRISAALTESRGLDHDEQVIAVRAAVARRELDRRKHGEPTLFEAPDDDRAERLVANRLSEVTLFVESECQEVARMVLHTLEADGFVLARRRHAAGPSKEGGGA